LKALRFLRQKLKIAQWSAEVRLGPLEAGDGMLMFGISTVMIFAVIQRLAQSRLGEATD